MTRALANVVGFDDAPFAREHRGDVLLVGVVCARTRVDGVVSGRVRRDGTNATDSMIRILERSPFLAQVRLVLLQGIAVAGFNVVDIERLHASLGVAVLVVARRQPRMAAIRLALRRVRGGDRKWRLIERAGPMEPTAGVFVQRCGLSAADAEATLRATTSHGKLPEALRIAHLIAGGVATGVSRGRA